MEIDKYDRELRLMLLLTNNNTLKIEMLSEKLKMSKRSIYRYIDAFKEMGFIVEKKGPYFRIDHRSAFFSRITEQIHFTEDEAMTINQVLNAVYDDSPKVRSLRAKFASLYRPDKLVEYGIDSHIAKNLSSLFTAIQLERTVMLRDYISPRSGVVSDRIVEPYLLLSENSEVRCYEVSSGMNKTFKISRAKEVCILDLVWENKDQHVPFYTDMFGFSGEQLYRVHLLMGPVASSSLLQECPLAERQMELQDDGRYLLTTDVCSYKGVARFVLGMYDDIEVVDSPDLQQFLNARIKDLVKKIK